MHKKIIMLLALLSQISFGQAELNFDFDFARFNYDNNNVYLEFYYNLNSKNMIVVEQNFQKLTEAIVHIEMKDTEADTFFINKDFKIQNIITADDSLGNSKNLSGVLGFPVPKGNYSIVVKAWDSFNKELSKTINENIKIEPYTNDKFSISDIELASNIKNVGADPNSLFYKNTLEVIPNPSMLFTAASPALFFYAELYHLILPDSSSNFSLQKMVYNSTGTNVYKSQKNIKQSSSSNVEIGVVNLSKFPTDTYNLVLSLVDNTSKQAFISSKRFFLYNPNVVDTTNRNIASGSVMGSMFGVLTIEECDRMFSEAKYIASQNEIDRYKSLDSLNAKRNFLMNFWKNRDTDPSTPQNEFQIEYAKRVSYANENFRHSNREGYLSDRGRVYLTYGTPDQRDFFPNEQNLKPHEMWFYNDIEGGVSFVFGDITGFGNYEILHSTKRGEVRDDNWMSRLSTQ